MVVARLPNPLNQALANRRGPSFSVNWGFKISVAFGVVSDTWDKSGLYYQKVVPFIDQISVTLVLLMFKKTKVPENMLITFNCIFVACSVLVLVILSIIIYW